MSEKKYWKILNEQQQQIENTNALELNQESQFRLKQPQAAKETCFYHRPQYQIWFLQVDGVTSTIASNLQKKDLQEDGFSSRKIVKIQNDQSQDTKKFRPPVPKVWQSTIQPLTHAFIPIKQLQKIIFILFVDIIESDLQNLQERLKVLNAQFLKSKVAELKGLKEDIGKLLEIFVYIQTGKENSFEGVKGFLQKQSTIDLNLNFMDYSSIDLQKVQDIWKTRIIILKQIVSQKSLVKHAVVLKQILDWTLSFYEVVIKQEILSSVEQAYQEYLEKKDSYNSLFNKNEFAYKYYLQLYQQLQNYIEAIQTHNPVVDEAFAESLTKLIEEILKVDQNVQGANDIEQELIGEEEDEDIQFFQEQDEEEDVAEEENKENKRQEIPNAQDRKKPLPENHNIINTQILSAQSTPKIILRGSSKENSDHKLVTIADNKSDDPEANENSSFKKLLQEKSYPPKIRSEKAKENSIHLTTNKQEPVELKGIKITRKRSSSQQITSSPEQNTVNLNNSLQTRFDSEQIPTRIHYRKRKKSSGKHFGIENKSGLNKDEREIPFEEKSKQKIPLSDEQNL